MEGVSRNLRKGLAASLAAATLFALTAPGAAAQGAGGLSSPNVTWVKNIPKHTDSSGARLVGQHFYITTGRDLTIYDVTKPEDPQEVGSHRFSRPGVPTVPQEDPDTNGDIFVTTSAGLLEVLDVSDKSAPPKVIGSLAGVNEHTISCVLNCTWAYGSEGDIVDLTDPTKPRLAGNWRSQHSVGSSHDVTEVAPGIILTATQPLLLLDARGNPAEPQLLARGASPDGRFVHATLWPNGGQDDFFLVGGESSGPGCSERPSSTFMTWSAKDWPATRAFQMIDQFKMKVGPPGPGTGPETTWCTPWFDEHPAYRNGGLVAIGWYEAGTRFLKISPDGKIEETGWFLPNGGQTSAAYWITDRVLYTSDYLRGMDILRFTGEIPPSGPGPAPGQQPPPPGGAPPAGPPSSPPQAGTGPSFAQVVGLPSARRCVGRRGLTLRLRSPRGDRLAAATVKVNRRTLLRARGRRVKPRVVLRRLPRGRFTVRVTVRTESGRTLSGKRRYKGCPRGR